MKVNKLKYLGFIISEDTSNAYVPNILENKTKSNSIIRSIINTLKGLGISIFFLNPGYGRHQIS